MNKTSLQRRHCERERPSRGLRILPQDFSILHLASQDVTQSIPPDCRDIEEYYLTRVRQLILKCWTEITKELVKRFPKKRSSSDWKHRKTLCHSRRNIVFSDYTLRVCYMNKIPDCLEKQAHYSSINIQDKKEGVATFSKEWFQGV